MTNQTATEATELDKSRRYLVPVSRLLLPDEPDLVHLALYQWIPRSDHWMSGLALCGRSTEQGALPEGTAVTCPSCPAYQEKYQAVLDFQAGLVQRSVPQPAVQASLLAEVRAAVAASGLTRASIANQLHVGNKHLSFLLTGRARMSVEWAERILGLCGLELVLTVRPRDGGVR